MGDSCLIECPTNYEPDANYLKCIKKETIAILKENFDQSNLVPFPFTIALFFFAISVVVAKF